MSTKYTTDELNNLDAKQLMQIILLQQEQIKALNENFERVLEQLRIANQNRFGRRSEKMDVIDGQLSIFDEAEALSDDSDEPQVEEVVQAYKRKKQKKQARCRSGRPSGGNHSNTCRIRRRAECFLRRRQLEVYAIRNL